MSEFEMHGTVTFQFSGIKIVGDDPAEAIHEVETMSVSELLEYTDDVVDVHVEGQHVTGPMEYKLRLVE